MPTNPPDDGRIGKQIDWSLVIPSVTRPVWEPPALEVLDPFDATFVFDLSSDKMKSIIPNTEVRMHIVDLACEIMPLFKYGKWVEETLEEARRIGDSERVGWYEGLLEEVNVQFKGVYREIMEVWNGQRLGRTMADPWPECKVEDDVEVGIEGAGRIGDADEDVETQSVSSTTSYATANNEDNLSTHNGHDLGDLIDLSPLPVDDVKSADDIGAVLESTGIAEMSEVDRLLS